MQTSAELIEPVVQQEYRVVRLSREHLADLMWLHEQVYGVVMPADYFLKKYDTAYTGVEYAGLVAYNADNTPVAYYGVIPCFIEREGEVILAAQSADTMTHPGFRFKGMFVELSLQTFELCKQLGIRLIFGFPNQNSYHGAVNKLEWKMTESMEYFTIPVKTIPLQAICSKTKWLNKCYRAYSRWLLRKKISDNAIVRNTFTKEGFATLQRSEAYANYKTYSPGKVIRVKNALVWLSGKPGMLIGDIAAVNEPNFDQLIRSLKKTAAWLGIREIQFHSSPGTKIHALFSEKYKARPSYPVLFQDFGSTIPPEQVKFTFADIDIF
jgi:hypothetical protein